jgi:hypothetical protein
MRRLAFVIVLVGIACYQTRTPAQQRPQDVRQWLQLFNGRDLSDWTIKFAKHDLGENFRNTFRVEEGLLKVRYDQWPKFDGEFGHIFYKDPFSYYLLAAEYRFVGEQVAGAPSWAIRNNGLMLHSPHPRTMLKDQDFPISLEIQLLGGLGKGPRTTANLCTPGTNVVLNGQLHTPHCTNSTSQTYDGDQWVRVEVLVHGDDLVRHIIDGKSVLEYSKPQIGGGAVDRRVHFAPGGNRARRFPQGRASQSRGLHGSCRRVVQVLFRQVQPGDVSLSGRAIGV